MTIDWWTLGLQAVNVLVLLLILSRFLFRPVSEIIAQRQAAATEELDGATAAKAKAEAALAKAKAETESVAARRGDLIAEAQAEAEREKKQALEEARRDLDKLRSEAKAEMARQKEAGEKVIRREASELAIDIAARLLDRLPGSARASAFIDGLAEAVSRLPERTRSGIGASGPVPIRSAVALSGDEVEALKERLNGVLGRSVDLALSVDPDLIAGLELDAPDAIVRNHFRADLDRVRQELLHYV